MLRFTLPSEIVISIISLLIFTDPCYNHFILGATSSRNTTIYSLLETYFQSVLDSGDQSRKSTIQSILESTIQPGLEPTLQSVRPEHTRPIWPSGPKFIYQRI